jgi:CarD family transcriptional regulator
MYSIGNKVVHPCYGAGTIVQIDEKQIGTLHHSYYIVRLCESKHNTDIMVPVKRADEMGLRPVGHAAALRETLDQCSEAPEDVEADYRVRRVWASELLKSGSFERVTFMVRCLTLRNSQRPLGLGERDTLQEGKAMLAAELALAADQELADAMAEVEGRLEMMIEEEV